MKDTIKGLFDNVKILFLGAGLILFTQAVKLIKNPDIIKDGWVLVIP